MLLLQLFAEFFCVGLFAVGGGLATIPFLMDMSTRTGWFTLDELTNMIAISESTPGPLGVNMASYVGYMTAGVPGSVVASLGLVSPCIVIILIIAAFLKRFRDNPYVKGLFYGLRPASTGLIAAAGFSVICLSLVSITRTGDAFFDLAFSFSWKAIVLAAIILVLTHFKKTKSVHPVVWILASAIVGALFEM